MKRFRKVYNQGGFMEKNNALFGQLAGTGAGLLEAFVPSNRPASPALAGAQGALSGAAAGSAFGPIGTGVGAGVGLLYGSISSVVQRRNQRIANDRARTEQMQADRDFGNAVYANNPELATGFKGASYYAMGGKLPMAAGVRAFGGKLRPLSDTRSEVVGPSHSQGGVDLPQYNAEVEGGETLSGPKVFSKVLGFAQQHRPIAKAIGKIEQKPATPERINALTRLKQREEALFNEQEALKAQIFST